MGNKVWTVKEIKEKLLEDDHWVARAVLALYDRQEADEQEMEYTSKKNFVGFNAFDAKFLSSLAKQYKKKGFLTRKQIDTARKHITKYAKQLTAIANGNL